ncbi:16S rRNA (guanine(966)-N(2))-methyltransferase RsmD [Geoalkalibacter ferrihydriticus]|uniref:16S rRNA (Guanine(966)-N(2))-methyltransferase RsmD n=1 Tax=Geoalkalibacter ferrihydriticus TaxID=392333 RepID=A0A1G9QZ47_9BACT|nr:16S rRNA (guanine(966)-N(2))-methyltransferase RsmD [Geoalkalibacter ferrihydriticus]SDM16151.1 16S rRNA (guanine(966)-N(2))-methyltransferase RsmD [Geoalkalibacter ferrihydriticus]
MYLDGLQHFGRDMGSPVRIVSGSARGTRLAGLAGKDIRPTSDRVREAIFSIIYSRLGELTGKSVLDLYAGTGALALEALSRGAQRAVVIDAARQAIRTIEFNARACRLAEGVQILCGTVAEQLARLPEDQPFDLIFFDPPYDKGLVEKTLQLIGDLDVLAAGGLVCAESSARESIPTIVAGQGATLVLADSRIYGATAVHFFTHSDAEDSHE